MTDTPETTILNSTNDAATRSTRTCKKLYYAILNINTRRMLKSNILYIHYINILIHYINNVENIKHDFYFNQ
jgi:hypothetical protein